MSKGKNPNGVGSFYRRSNGTWVLTIREGYQENGKRKRKSFCGKTQKEAREKLKQYQRDKEDGIRIEENMTFTRWANLWFNGHKENVSMTTREGYKYTLHILESYFGETKLSDIRVTDIETFIREKNEEGLSPSYLRKFRTMLYQIFDKAEANDLIRKNPVRYAEKIKAIAETTERDSFTEDEVKLLMKELPYDRMGNSIRLLIGTGMRSQELLGLEPRHIAEDGSFIRIEQALKLVKGTPVIGIPKTKDSRRVIPVPAGLKQCAVALRTTADKYVWEVGVPGQPCNPTYFRDQFKKYLECIPGVRILTPHCCRHTYVSQMQALGVDLETIRSLVGHVDIDMTSHYCHVQDPTKQRAIEAFDQSFVNQYIQDNACI